MAKKKEEDAKKKEPRKGMGVYTLKQSQSVKGAFQKNGSIVTREKACITHAHADEINSQTERNGKFAELNKDADKKYQESMKAEKAEK